MKASSTMCMRSARAGLMRCAPVALLLACPVAVGETAVVPAPVRVVLVGDSTMATRTGYGDALCARFIAQVECINLARGGRSTSSYRAEGLWKAVEAMLRDTTGASKSYVLIQFGHNDQPGKPGRSTDLATEFPPNLMRFVQETWQLQAVPVLVTPLTRRSFQGAQLTNDLRPWAEAALEVGRRSGVNVVDLNRWSAALVQEMGQDAADTLAMEPAPPKTPAIAASQPGDQTVKTRFDRTHVGVKGAHLFAALMQRAVSDAVPDLKGYFKGD